MKLKDCTEGYRFRKEAMSEALRCRGGELNKQTVLDYIGFACGATGATNTLVLPYDGRIFYLKIDIAERQK